MAFKKDGEVKVFKITKSADSSVHEERSFERLLVDDLVKNDQSDEAASNKDETKKNKDVSN